MRTLIAMCVALVAVAAMAEEPQKSAPAAGTKVYQTDRYGNVQYHKPGYVVKGDRVYSTDAYGNVAVPTSPASVVQGNRVYQTDPYGNVQYAQAVVHGAARRAGHCHGCLRPRRSPTSRSSW